MKNLIIPDVHGRTFWKDAINKHLSDVDKIIFLGDYLDPYSWEKINRLDAIKSFKEIVDFKKENMDKLILLLGNHDLQYWDDHFFTLSRYDSINSIEIERLFTENRPLFSLVHEEKINGKKYLFSHGGLMNSWVNSHMNIIKRLTIDNLNNLLYSRDGILILCDVSKYRTKGGYNVGSIVWSDVREKFDNENESVVLPFDYQVFGHSQQDEDPIITDKWACLDCRKAFLLDEKGEFQIIN